MMCMSMMCVCVCARTVWRWVDNFREVVLSSVCSGGFTWDIRLEATAFPAEVSSWSNTGFNHSFFLEDFSLTTMTNLNTLL